MATPLTSKKYRIGDFARYMGVTADFLKHYEENGLLTVHTSESGYRYYGFEQSARVLEYQCLRNYGVSVKEMHDLLLQSPEEAIARLDEKVEKMQADIARMQSLVEEHQRLKRWHQERLERPIDWEIRHVEPYCFLFHSKMTDFLKDEAIYALLKTWVEWLPITKSAIYVKAGEVGAAPEPFWGLAVPKSLLLHHHIPVNDAVIEVPFGKAFIFHFNHVEETFNMQTILDGTHLAIKTLQGLGLKPAGDALLIREIRLADEDGRARGGMGRFMVPIAA